MENVTKYDKIKSNHFKQFPNLRRLGNSGVLTSNP